MPDQPVVVITGASSGIGAALAQRLGQDQYRLVLAARNKAGLDAAAAGAGALAVPVVTDVTRREDVIHLRDKALETFGTVDVWINNAGRGITRPTLHLSEADFDEMMSVNVKSALFGAQAILPHFIEQDSGHLINVSSFLARVPTATIRSAYSAAKAALNSLTANLRYDLSLTHPNIHISLIMPGIVANDFHSHALGTPSGQSRTTGAMPAQTSEEVAAVIAQLIREPKAEVYSNPALAAIAQRYIADVAAFEAHLRQNSRPSRT